MVLSGFPSPLLNACARAVPAGVPVCPVIPTPEAMDSLFSHRHEPLIFICANFQEAALFFANFSPGDFFGEFRAKKTIIFADASKPIWQDMAKSLLPVVDAYATADCVMTPLPAEKWIPDVYLPIPESEWASETEEKVDDVVFYGSVGMFKERQDVLQYLHGQGVPVLTGGGQEFGYPLDFMSTMRRARITLNFSNCNTGDGEKIHHVKGRIWEAAVSRTLIVESANPITPKLFTHGEMTWFAKKEDLPALLRNLLLDDELRSKMTSRMFEKATHLVRPEIFWGKLT
jgi:Glycosyl transferases group 1